METSMVRTARIIFPIVLLLAIFSSAATAQTGGSPSSPSTTASQAAQPFDINAAVEAYLAKVPAERRARSNAYFEGGYWLVLWDFLVTMFVMWLLLALRWSARMRDLAERLTRFRALQTALYWLQFFVVTFVLTFPMTLYESYFREHQYDLLNQSFGPWMRDQLVAFAVNLILGALVLMALFAIVRRLGKSWWVWGAVVSVLFIAFTAMIAPVYILPLFNKFTILQDARIKDPILSLARANGIPATDVYEFDASRQSDRVSANVSGFASTLRVSLNDNLLKRCTLPEIEATLGHEMGHYVLNHIYKGIIINGVLIVIGFAFLNWGTLYTLGRWGERWGIRDITDVAVLPLAVAVMSIYFFVLTPVFNTVTRTMEFEADMYGLNAAQQPDGEANVALLLGEYRKLDPGPIEEIIFFDHPSGRTRITASMRWKAEHPQAANPEEESRPYGAPARN
jgi:Zn-dependent protease with chaperone function